MSIGNARFDQHVLIDKTPMPDSIPAVKEIGTTSAPLLSAAYFIGARCRPYNDDYMQCKTEAHGKGELVCMKEGRKVTRCAASVLEDINKNCLDEFRMHWNCLEQWNHQLWQCRRPERRLNKCVFDKIGLEKTIPDTPPNEKTPVHLRQQQIYATFPQYEPGHPDSPKIFRPLKPLVDRVLKADEGRLQRKREREAQEGQTAEQPAKSS